jgi:tetratricopeptide (TPR) repeat protein
MRVLIIEHVPESNPAAFRVVRCDPPQISPDVVPIAAPEQFGADQLPGTDLRRELRWYLERFLDYPFPPNTDRADRAVNALEAWGTHAFKALFHGGMARDWYRDAVRDGTEHLQLRIIANEPSVLAWPWEALHDPERGYLAHKCHIERQLNNVADPPPLPENLPRDRLSILLVTARPFEGDVEYRSISRALVEQIDAHHLAACVTVLRPPTFDALREELARRPGYYHIVHFDGHGGYGIIADDTAQAATLAEAVNPHAFQGPQGCLVFETADGKPDPVPAETLSATLHEFRIPMVVLNACQSATIDENAESAFASVAASLVRAGIRSVVAMAWSLYVSGAQQFLPAFYRRLLETGDLAEPTRAGRAAMLAHPGRVCARGTYPLKDWLVPVVYQQQPADLSFVTQAKPKQDEQMAASLPEEATDKENPYGFIGRDSAILALERALLRDPPVILIHGLGGVGKTTLARGFLQWLRQTEGLSAGCLWFTFNDIHTAEYVLNGIGTQIFGSQFITFDTEQKLAALGKALRENRLILVWDNFESASGNEAAGIDPLLRPDDLQLLRRFLQAIQGGRSKVLITSRSEESWLPAHLRYKLSLGGLTGESRWEFCTAILRNLGIQTNREDPELAALMDTLDGHPLLMRAVLPRLEGGRSAKSILQELQGNLAADAAGADPTQEKVYATLRFVEDGLPRDLRPVLVPLGLHDRFVDARLMEAMAKNASQTQVTRRQIDRLLSALATAGLVRDRGQAIYELHPALTGFLRSTVLTQAAASELESWQRAFVDVIGSLADALAPKELHEQRPYFQIHSANFHAALSLADALGMDTPLAALTQSLAAHAQNTLSFDSAERLVERFAEHGRARGDSKVEASACHQFGMIAQERRDFETAEKWYLKSLQISEKLGIDDGAASTYHQLGRIAQERRDFETAETWYLKSVGISERLGNKHVAPTSHQLGTIAEERRDFETAEKWYLKSLEISEKFGVDFYAAMTYHHLGRIAQERRDFGAAEKWYLKSLEISEKLGVDSYAASTYHQLGMIAQLRQDLDTAEKWYLKSLEISEKLGVDSYAASTYHQLGVIAQLRQDLETAEKWYLKSLVIKEKQRNEHGAAITYHQLGVIAHLRQDYEMAERWYLKSLEIKKNQGDEYGAASTYGQLGIMARERAQFLESAEWYIRCMLAFQKWRDPHGAAMATQNFMVSLGKAPKGDAARMLKLWQDAGLPRLGTWL